MTESRFDANRGGSALTPLVGREEEVDLLLRRWSQTKDGEGQVVLLSGEPGIGKSRILSTLRERLEARGRTSTALPVLALLREQRLLADHRQLRTDAEVHSRRNADAKLDKLEALIVTHYGRPLADVRFVAIDPVDPIRARYGALPLTPQKHKDETLRTLIDLVEAAAREATQRDAVRGCALGRPHHAGGVGSADRPSENRSSAGRADPPAGVSVALVRAGTCRRTEPVQADPGAECRDGLGARAAARHCRWRCSSRS